MGRIKDAADRIAARLFPRFPDYATQRRYVSSERTSRLPATRGIIALGIIAFVLTIFSNYNFLPLDLIAAYNKVAVFMLATLILWFAATRTRYYLDHPWIDFAAFLGLAVGTVFLIRALWGQTVAMTGITSYGMAVIMVANIVIMASIGFVAASRVLMIWLILVLAAVVLTMLWVDWPEPAKAYVQNAIVPFLIFAGFVNIEADRRAQAGFAAREALDAERRNSQELLYNVLPPDVADRLRSGQSVTDAFPAVAVIFADIVGFSQLTRQLAPETLVDTLNRFFSVADGCAKLHRVEKVKTIGDAYLAVVRNSHSTPAAVVAIGFARDLIERTAELAEALDLPLKVRVGIHCGPVIGGVIGTSRLAYDYWGDTMNVASRIEGTAEANGVAVSQAAYDQARGSYAFAAPEAIVLKGVGEMQVYRLARDDAFPS